MFHDKFTDERIERITLKAGMLSFRIITLLSFITTFVFALRRKGVIKIDELSMQEILMAPAIVGIFFFWGYKWLYGAIRSEAEIAAQKYPKGKRFAFKNIFVLSALASAGISVFAYFNVFKNDIASTISIGIFLLAAFTAISYFTMGKVGDNEQI
ncbi:MAG: hypothetical protein V4642_04020 [Bacteroidota bacterium]